MMHGQNHIKSEIFVQVCVGLQREILFS